MSRLNDPYLQSGFEIADDASVDADENLLKAEEETSLISKDGDSKDAPEALVRHENKALGITRIIVFVALMASAIVTAFLVFRFARESEEDSFDSQFAGVAGRLIDGMESDTALKFWVGRTLSSSISLAMQQSGTNRLNLTFSQSIWDSLTGEARFNANVFFVAWSPMILNDQERTQFEEFAQQQVFTLGSNPSCYLCGGDPNQGFVNPAENVEIPGFGVYPCGPLDGAARAGIVPEENCVPISFAVQGTCQCGELPQEVLDQFPTNEVTIPDSFFRFDQDGNVVPEEFGNAPYHPIWQAQALAAKELPVLYNENEDPIRKKTISQSLTQVIPVMSETFIKTGPLYEQYLEAGGGESVGVAAGLPGTLMYYPVLDPVTQAPAGTITMELFWGSYLSAVFPPQSDLVDMVVENTCGENFTFRADLDSESLDYVGIGDLHDSSYSDMVRSSTFDSFEQVVNLAAFVNQNQSSLEYCRYRFHVFATEDLEDEYITKKPLIYAIITGVIFVFTSAVFIFYDVIVGRRQRKVMEAANRTNDIVTDLFPKEVRDRLYERAAEEQNQESKAFMSKTTTNQMQNFLASDAQGVLGSEPIADFFPHTTVMFLDLVGFTAWSSEREPSQVFRLLETIYQSFDEAAKSLGVFKVETIGDSYVAVCGLPKPREQHAVIMAQFANVCLRRMLRLTSDLEKYLGPSTGELRARVGLHSGPVTAGVLRGEKARFQLFGDTVNTASRLESSGMPHRIHVSKETADLLTASGKGHWVNPRRELVQMKGKGDLQTYWVAPSSKGGRGSATRSTTGSVTAESSDEDVATPLRKRFGSGLGKGQIYARSRAIKKKNARLVEWNVEVLFSLLEKVVQARAANDMSVSLVKTSIQKSEKELLERNDGKIVMDEMTYMIPLPNFDEDGHKVKSTATVPPVVKEQLFEFVTQISNLYRENPFHNFEHASHVIMSAGKLMKRIVNPDGLNFDSAEIDEAKEIHKQTYGICSDRLMQFAVVFSALIHDVDHTGLTNAELVKMGIPMCLKYRDKSVAEQNSVDVAWGVLLDDRFKDLRACIYTNDQELQHFRQLIVNAVIATDIADKELKTLRESRWDKAFSDTEPSETAPALEDPETSDRKATIIFEYIIQASDVAHTMQHWHTYQKFNRRLFQERYLAWKAGHAGEKDPSEFWYKGELWFFDNYIIPLARKLDKCGVFGVSYHEYLQYAKENRKEWEVKGDHIVAEFLEECREKYDSEDKTSDHFEDDDIVEVSAA